MIKFYLSFLLCFFTFTLFAQKSGTVKGVSFDDASKEVISSATISILDKKDSSLISFTMTDSKGGFEVKNLPAGEYRVLITHINYHNKAVSFSITDSTKIVDLGHIIMNDKSKTLDEIVIAKEEPPVTLVGDTVQYNAGSFKTVPNASVEQLLKKLPGVEVDKDGTIKAQGEKVTRVLVDGKEFFGNDPKMATKNLPADAIDKVQVFNKQSEQAMLTGFEDGNYEKTINLKLKKDKKKGVFGKVTAGAGTNDRLEGRINVNSFKGAKQLSAIGMGNNTNSEGFSFMDMMSFSGGMGRMSGGSFTLSGSDAASMGLGGAGSGINTIWGSGLNYNNIIGSKLDLQSSYFYNHYNPDNERHIQRQNIITPGVENIYNENSFSKNLNNSHRANFNLLYQIDSFHSIRVMPNINYQKTRNNSQSDYQTNVNGIKLNEGNSDISNNSEGYQFKSDIMFRKKFRRRGRTFSASLQTNFNGSNSDGQQLSFKDFYDKNGNLFTKDTINQHSHSDAGLKSYNTRLVFTEPVFKSSLLELNVNKSNSINTSEIITYNYNAFSSKFDMLNDSLTNDFRNTYDFTNAGLRMRTQKNKYNYSIGINWQQAELQGKVISGIKDSVISKTFNNLLLNARFQYNISKFRTFGFSYNTSTNQPSLSQLQPVPDNSNPLYIRKGNPDLKQEYVHTIQGNLNLVRPFENKNLFLFLTFQTTQNKIVNADSFDLITGIRRTQPINVSDGVYNLNSNISYSMPLRFIKGTVELNTRAAYYKGKQFINGDINNTNTLTLAPGLRFNLNPSDKLNLVVGYNMNYNNAKYATQNNRYFNHQFNTAVEWEMPKGFFVTTDFAYIINTQRAAGFNGKVPVWNAYLSKRMLNFNRGEIKLSATDLFNQNIGISRNNSSNFIEDVRVKTLPRFFMLSFTYNLTKTGLNRAGTGGMKINIR